ncbi:MAG: cation:proton antiporter, partial [Gammaproteobacteria bacterium]
RVIEELTTADKSRSNEIFDDKSAVDKLLALYANLRSNTRRKMDSLIRKNFDLLNRLNHETAIHELHSAQMETLIALHKNEIITSKLFIMLKNELQKRSGAE